MQVVQFSQAHASDLIVDAVYRGGRKGNASDDPLPRLLHVSNSGGFRYRGRIEALELVVLTSSGRDPDWPDALDLETGIYTYFGDNKRPGRKLHGTPRKGNELLRRIFHLARSDKYGRERVPPIFLFANTGEWRDVVFLGLAVPGTADLRASEDLVAIWRSSRNKRFMNYRARFSVLDTQSVSRAWIKDIVAGAPHSDNAPRAWTKWVSTGRYRVLRAARSLEYRTRDEQIPVDPDKRAILEQIHQFFKGDSHAFEHCAAELAKLMLPDIFDIDLTRPSRDGGRDAVGKLKLGSGDSGILVDFALEAKCYIASSGVGVLDMSRLISRLRHRQFGILVTTSYVNSTAYREVKEDQHPIIVISGSDIVDLLRGQGISSVDSVTGWLKKHVSLAD